MPKLIYILILTIFLEVTGCAQHAGLWHQRIVSVPSTLPMDAVDPDTGMPLWHDFADGEFKRPLSRETAFQVLLNTQTFACEYVGFAGSKSIQVEAFQVLLTQTDAKAVFSDLLDRAKTAGKLYALCAFYLIAPDQYAEAEKRVLAVSDTVTYQVGCMIMPRPVLELVHCSDPNTVHLRSGETVEQWYARVKPPGGGAMRDIFGGAIPMGFKGAR